MRIFHEDSRYQKRAKKAEQLKIPSVGAEELELSQELKYAEKSVSTTKTLSQSNTSARRPTQSEVSFDNGGVTETRESIQQRNTRVAVSKKTILINIVVDGTYSFTKVFPRVYDVIEKFLRKMEKEGKEYPGVIIKYGMTVLHDFAESWKYKNGEYFTENKEEFLINLKKVKFYGGSPGGRENLSDAVDEALRVLNNSEDENAERGLLFFSDSIPEDNNLQPNFLETDQEGYLNKGLRFAIFFTYDDTFTPMLKMTDRNGDEVENGKNEAAYHSLNELLSSNRNVLLAEVERIVWDILQQISIR